ncbi:hypothetical protein CkaCkLH20_07753 [Colletotrichum karsti]|uniref:Zn(2)-C6 fungal-type domain-containing protein n=1 Tax=Colletotrichum karsti TaxID=1095194 RepID=A0A9P6I436_9PEZI|nr:uncharacterized protein CkaCkLH20_07753 [Colletotrichum karsti]KAF9874616.1 hypothetical protein CkaCkLH20_07753 [Colletotrichum karsti]
MARLSKQKACTACTESKRRCDKTLPSCTRCDDRDIDCHYPPTKRRRHRLHETAGTQDPSAAAPTSAAVDLFSLDADPLLPVGLCNAPWIDFSTLPPDLPTNLASYVPSTSTSPEDAYRSQNITNPPISSQNKTIIDSLAQSKWFLAPSTWHIDRRPNPQRDTYPTSVLTNFTRGLQTWVKRWVLHGHNPFIHRSMYAEGNHFPSAIQDALTSASLYHHKTPDNEAFVHRILDERVAALMASQPVADETTLCVPLLETRDHLARVQALFVYTIIRLFDGSVTQRTAAEAHLPTLSLWCRQLWDSAVLDANTLSADLIPGSKYCTPSSSGPQGTSGQDTYDSDLAVWNLWVLSESVRRTWLLATCTIGVYATLKGNWSECPGGALFTTRAGLWDAPSAPRWAAMCRELASSGGEEDVYARLRPDEWDAGSCGKTFFVPSFRSDGLFCNAAAAEVDECARHLFTVIWGLDRVESWALRTASAGEVCLTY